MSLAFGITSFVVVCLIAFIMLRSKIIPTKGTVCFKYQLVLFMFYLFIDIFCYIYAKYLQGKGVQIESTSEDTILLRTFVLFSFSILIILYLVNFKYAMIQMSKALPIYFPGFIVLSVVVLFLPLDISMVNNSLIFAGIAKAFRDGVCGFILASICVLTICTKNEYSRREKECFLVWSIIWAISFAIELIVPKFSLMPMSCAFGYLSVFIFIENPENKQSLRKKTMLFYYISDCFDYLKNTAPYINVVGIKMDSEDEINRFLEEIDTSPQDFFLFEEDGKNFYAVFTNKNVYVPKLEKHIRENDLKSLYFDEFYIKDTLKLSLFFKNNIDKVEKGTMYKVSEKMFYKQDKEFEIKRQIEEALANKKIVTYIQPIFDVKKKKFTCGECLCRIKKDDGELMMPSSFVKVAEKYGLICHIETEMFKNMCKTLQKKDEIGLEHLDANLSIRKGESPVLYEEYCSIIEKYKIDGKSINLEITETDVIKSKKTLIKNMKNLRDLGISFSLDDFGTGESNLGYMIDMPVDIIKFDREIFQKATSNEKAKIVVKHTIEMAHSLGLQVIAEGIEVEDDVRFCESIGVDFIQGFYFSKPIPSNEFEEFCKEKNFMQISANEQV